MLVVYTFRRSKNQYRHTSSCEIISDEEFDTDSMFNHHQFDIERDGECMIIQRQ